MKDSYTIHEIASLYGVGPDALRYYERLGLVKPRRGENGYRIYDLNDIYRLTIIRDLRSLGFSMERIGEYLKDLSVANTLQLLDEERRLIREKMRALRAAEGAIRARVRHLQACAIPPLWSCRRAPACASTPTSPAMRRWTLPSSACTAATRTPSAIWAGRRSAPASPRRTYAPGGKACTARCSSY